MHYSAAMSHATIAGNRKRVEWKIKGHLSLARTNRVNVTSVLHLKVTSRRFISE